MTTTMTIDTNSQAQRHADARNPLHDMGWNSGFEAHYRLLYGAAAESDKLLAIPGRVVRQDRDSYLVWTPHDVRRAVLAGALRRRALDAGALPAVGDWVTLEGGGAGVARVRDLLPRFSILARRAAGDAGVAQVIAANVDTLLICTDVARDFNPRRLERYATVAAEGGVVPVIVLGKADLCADAARLLAEAAACAAGSAVHLVSAQRGDGVEELRAYFARGRTVALAGSSGVGKSTLLNRLLGQEYMRTAEVREDDGRGRHTTTHRELVAVPGGGLLIDTPGMRELGLASGAEALGGVFGEIGELAAGCRFRDCAHEHEPGCAVRGAVADGTLSRERFESFLKLRAELRFEARKEDPALRAAEVQRWRVLHKAARKHMRRKYGDA
jgi:ribosome biogenesis GTPase